ncbi:unnamed protein product [Chrysoparadoxa australica]
MPQDEGEQAPALDAPSNTPAGNGSAALGQDGLAPGWEVSEEGIGASTARAEAELFPAALQLSESIGSVSLALQAHLSTLPQLSVSSVSTLPCSHSLQQQLEQLLQLMEHQLPPVISLTGLAALLGRVHGAGEHEITLLLVAAADAMHSPPEDGGEVIIDLPRYLPTAQWMLGVLHYMQEGSPVGPERVDMTEGLSAHEAAVTVEMIGPRVAEALASARSEAAVLAAVRLASPVLSAAHALPVAAFICQARLNEECSSPSGALTALTKAIARVRLATLLHASQWAELCDPAALAEELKSLEVPLEVSPMCHLLGQLHACSGMSVSTLQVMGALAALPFQCAAHGDGITSLCVKTLVSELLQALSPRQLGVVARVIAEATGKGAELSQALDGTAKHDVLATLLSRDETISTIISAMDMSGSGVLPMGVLQVLLQSGECYLRLTRQEAVTVIACFSRSCTEAASSSAGSDTSPSTAWDALRQREPIQWRPFAIAVPLLLQMLHVGWKLHATRTAAALRCPPQLNRAQLALLRDARNHHTLMVRRASFLHAIDGTCQRIRYMRLHSIVDTKQDSSLSTAVVQGRAEILQIFRDRVTQAEAEAESSGREVAEQWREWAKGQARLRDDFVTTESDRVLMLREMVSLGVEAARTDSATGLEEVRELMRGSKQAVEEAVSKLAEQLSKAEEQLRREKIARSQAAEAARRALVGYMECEYDQAEEQMQETFVQQARVGDLLIDGLREKEIMLEHGLHGQIGTCKDQGGTKVADILDELDGYSRDIKSKWDQGQGLAATSKRSSMQESGMMGHVQTKKRAVTHWKSVLERVDRLGGDLIKSCQDMVEDINVMSHKAQQEMEGLHEGYVEEVHRAKRRMARGVQFEVDRLREVCDALRSKQVVALEEQARRNSLEEAAEEEESVRVMLQPVLREASNEIARATLQPFSAGSKGEGGSSASTMEACREVERRLSTDPGPTHKQMHSQDAVTMRGLMHAWEEAAAYREKVQADVVQSAVKAKQATVKEAIKGTKDVVEEQRVDIEVRHLLFGMVGFVEARSAQEDGCSNVLAQLEPMQSDLMEHFIDAAQVQETSAALLLSKALELSGEVREMLLGQCSTVLERVKKEVELMRAQTESALEKSKKREEVEKELEMMCSDPALEINNPAKTFAITLPARLSVSTDHSFKRRSSSGKMMERAQQKVQRRSLARVQAPFQAEASRLCQEAIVAASGNIQLICSNGRTRREQSCSNSIVSEASAVPRDSTPQVYLDWVKGPRAVRLASVATIPNAFMLNMGLNRDSLVQGEDEEESYYSVGADHAELGGGALSPLGLVAGLQH